MYTGTGEVRNYGQVSNARVHPTNMQHGLVYQMRKSRGINWTHDEKVFLVNLCAARARIIEEKRSDSNTLRMKAACWKVIYDQFSTRFGRKRTLVRIKEQWKRMKLATRAEQRDRDQEILDSSTGNGSSNTQEPVPTKYYGESAEIIAKVKQILNEVASSTFDNCIPVSQNDISIGETNAILDDISRFSDHVTGEMQSNVELPVSEPEPMVIKIEIDDNEDAENYHDSGENKNKSNTSPELLTSVIDFNSLEEIGHGRHDNSEPTLEHGHTPASSYSHLSTDDVTQIKFSTDIISNTGTSTPEVNKSLYDPEQSFEQWGNFRKMKTTNSQKSDQDITNVSSSIVDNMRLEYARIEHEKKMEYLRKEHEIKMEILNTKRETARAKLRKANFKLSLTGSNVPM
ncbi:uncharacterized protein LOC117344241 [Pecten maximus]|uniref:uncharacterized protein LOC117344241 n=1 Tax=Pecten maximus TaxID=6579 RepID=UPI001457E60A|nr:uncharacterized protein LOC117344241 [Pecten maximus]